MSSLGGGERRRAERGVERLEVVLRAARLVAVEERVVLHRRRRVPVVAVARRAVLVLLQITAHSYTKFQATDNCEHSNLGGPLARGERELGQRLLVQHVGQQRAVARQAVVDALLW